jgi:hypothetical protein
MYFTIVTNNEIKKFFFTSNSFAKDRGSLKTGNRVRQSSLN